MKLNKFSITKDLLQLYLKDKQEWKVEQAYKLLVDSSLNKEAGVKEFFSSPLILNFLNLLTPFINDWRIREAVKLIQDYAKETKR